MKITDKKKTVFIEMKTWNGSGYGPDWSKDFFNASTLTMNGDAYIVEDVDYCIDAAREWEAEDENNAVFVEE